MKFYPFLVLVLMLLSSCEKEITPVTPARLIFIDNFDGTSLNTSKWNYRQLGSFRGDSYVTDNAVKVENGYLKIMVYSDKNDYGSTHNSGMIATENSLKQKFGYFEARIKFSTLPGMWSAFWIQSPTVSSDLPYEKAGVEIDVVEHRAIDINGYEIPDLLAQTLHWGGYGSNHQQIKYRQDNMAIGSEFHTYGVEWTTDKYTFYYDGKPTQTWTRADRVPISQVAQYIILSTEVQDKNWAGSIPESGYGNAQNTNAYMLVDWVKVYDKKP